MTRASYGASSHGNKSSKRPQVKPYTGMTNILTITSSSPPLSYLIIIYTTNFSHPPFSTFLHMTLLTVPPPHLPLSHPPPPPSHLILLPPSSSLPPYLLPFHPPPLPTHILSIILPDPSSPMIPSPSPPVLFHSTPPSLIPSLSPSLSLLPLPCPSHCRSSPPLMSKY